MTLKEAAETAAASAAKASWNMRGSATSQCLQFQDQSRKLHL